MKLSTFDGIAYRPRSQLVLVFIDFGGFDSHVFDYTRVSLCGQSRLPEGLIKVDNTTSPSRLERPPTWCWWRVTYRGGDLRNTRLVMIEGKPMDADALRTVSGFSGWPKNVRPERSVSIATTRSRAASDLVTYPLAPTRRAS